MNIIQLAMGLSSQGLNMKEIEEVLKQAARSEAIRLLNNEEKIIFAGAIARAVTIAPYYRDAIALMRPFKDHTTPTLYTDKYSRVGIGAPFFHESHDVFTRAAELIHEAMHVMNHHFTREPPVKISSETSNIASDFEINPLVKRMLTNKASLEHFIFPKQKPWSLPDERSFEQYAQLLKDKGFDKEEQSENSDAGSPDENSEGGNEDSPSNNEGGNSESSPAAAAQAAKEASQANKTPSGSCDVATPARSDAADDIGVDQASASEQTVARQNTAARIKDEADKARSRGDQAALRDLQKMQANMKPAKVNWRSVFRRLMAHSRDKIVLGRTDYSYRKVSKRLSGGEYIFPGMIQYHPSAIMAIDTSGSMSMKDYQKLLSELDSIVKSVIRGKNNFKVFCVDAAATQPKIVNSVKDLDLKGGGGTAMEVAVKSVELLKKKDLPDLLIIATDGGTSWPALVSEIKKRKSKYKIIILITSDEQNAKEAARALGNLATVIDVSEEK